MIRLLAIGHRFACSIASCLLWLSLSIVTYGQEAQPAPAAANLEAEHAALRQLRANVVDAINKQDQDKLLSYLTADVVVTWQNAEVSRGPEAVRAYYDRMMKGPNRVVASFLTAPEVDQLAQIFGDTAFATEHSNDQFKLTDGRDFSVRTRWSATVVKQNGEWKVVGVHLSTNMFDNPILAIAIKETLKWTAIVAVPIGLIVGLIIGRLWGRKRSAS